MSLFAAMGVMITSATAIIYGEAIWDPVQLVGKFSSPVVVAISMFTVVVATIAVNIAANVVSPANDFANAFPALHQLQDRRADHRDCSASPFNRGGCSPIPRATSTRGCSATPEGLGSIAGVLVVDYWLVRRRELRLEDLIPGRRRIRRLEHARDCRHRRSAASSPGAAS